MRQGGPVFSAILFVAQAIACSSEKDVVVIGAEVPVFAEARESGEPAAKLSLGERIKVRTPGLGEKDWLSVRVDAKELFVAAKHVAPYPLTGTPYFATRSGKVGDAQLLPPLEVVIGDSFPALPLSNVSGILALVREGLIVGVIQPTELSTTAPTLADFKADLLLLLKSAPRSAAAKEVAKRSGLRSDADDELKDLIGMHKAALDVAGVEEIWLKLVAGPSRATNVAVGQDLFVGSPLAILRAAAAENAALVNILRINARVRVLEAQKPRSKVAVLVPASPEEAPAANSIEAPSDKLWVEPSAASDPSVALGTAPKRMTDRLKAESGLVGWVDTAVLRSAPIRDDTVRRDVAAAKNARAQAAVVEAMAVGAFLSPLDAAAIDEAYGAALKGQRYDLGFALLQLGARLGPVFGGLAGAPMLAEGALQMGVVAYVDQCRGSFLWAALRGDGELEDGTCHLIDRQNVSSFAESAAFSLPEGLEAPAASDEALPEAAAPAATDAAKKSTGVDKTRRVRLRLRNTTARYGGLAEGLFVATINLDAQCVGRPVVQVTTWRVPVPALGPFEVVDIWVTANHPAHLSGSAVALAASEAEAKTTVQSAVAAAESANDIGGAWGMGFVGDLPECQEEYAEPEDD